MTATATGPVATDVRFRTLVRRSDFRWLALGLGVSNLGAYAYHVSLYALVYEATRSPAWAAATTLGRFIPSLLFSTYGGVLADRVERRRLLISTDVVSTGVMVLLVAVAGLGLPIVLAIAGASLISILGTIYLPASVAMIPQVVEERQLAAANSFLGLVENVVTIAGPAVGAAVVALVDVEAGFIFCGLAFATSAFCSSRLGVRSRPVDVTQGGEAGLWSQVTAGFRALASSRSASALVAAAVGAGVFYGADTVLFVVLSERRLGLGPDGYGILAAGLGAGGILVAPLVTKLSERRRLAPVIAVALLAYTLPIAVLVTVTSPVVAVALQVVRGAGAIVVDVLAVTALQRTLPSDVTARVMGVFGTLLLAAISLGALVTSLLLDGLDLDGTLVALAGIGVLLAVATAPRMRAADRAAAAELDRLEPVVERLAALGIFRSANRTSLERLAEAAEVVEVGAGTTVVAEGEPSDALYVIVDGEVEVSAVGEAGVPLILRTLTAGDYFGEIGLLTAGPRTATVTALAPLVLERIPGEDFLAALTEHRPTAAFMEGARGRLTRTHPSKVEELRP